MHGKKVFKALAVTAALAAALPVAAQSDEAPGFYAGGGVGRNEHSEFAWRAFGGYQANKWLGAEFGYHDLGRGTIGSTTTDSSVWELVGIGRFPIVDRLAAYAKLGGYMGRAHGGGFNEKTTDLTYGLGVEYGFTRNIALRGEWQRYTDLGGGSLGSTDMDVLGLNVIYRFR
jgi:opacity protein-like surface antigen